MIPENTSGLYTVRRKGRFFAVLRLRTDKLRALGDRVTEVKSALSACGGAHAASISRGNVWFDRETGHPKTVYPQASRSGRDLEPYSLTFDRWTGVGSEGVRAQE